MTVLPALDERIHGRFLILLNKRVTIPKAHGCNTTTIVCSDISSHSYFDSPDKRAFGEGMENKTSLTIVIRAEDW